MFMSQCHRHRASEWMEGALSVRYAAYAQYCAQFAPQAQAEAVATGAAD